MAYLKRNVNVFLLLLIIIILGAMGAITVYYQTTYKSLAAGYDEKLSQLNELNRNLSVQRAQLISVNEELDVKNKVKEKFDQLYTNVSDFNSRLSAELNQTRDELVDTLTMLRAAEANLSAASSELTTTKGALKTQLNYTEELQSQVSALKQEACSLRKRLNETSSYC
ncbi:hypothetical protein HYY72_05785 [Candidatus Woesearchaeota archaeon]|nr:hypothetical protein [Candidatus Woesearchaeota archaeon]